MTVGIIAGFLAELRRLPDERRTHAACSGGQAAEAETRARAFAAGGVAGLVSFGLAGGLAPKLRPGALIVPGAVALPGGAVQPVDPSWHAALLTALDKAGLHVESGQIAGRDAPALLPADKAALAHETGAIAVDMESHAVAHVARESGLPFLVLRAIGDPADRAVPEAALAGLAPDGRTRPLAVMARLLRQPGALPGLILLARDSARGLKALGIAARFLSPPG